MKADRQRAVAGILREKAAGSQGQVVELLAEQGIEATQATVSRDLEEMGAVKVRTEGGVVYALPEEVSSVPSRSFTRLLAASVIDISASGNILVVKTPPGHAGMVASAIDRARLRGVIGSVAGDDTLLLVCSPQTSSDEAAETLKQLAGIEEDPKNMRGRS